MKWLAALLLVCGCSSSDPHAPVASRYSGPDPFTASNDGANDTFIDRSVACARVVSALNETAALLSCDLTPAPSCPALVEAAEAKLGAPACYRYDEGVIANCEHRIQSYETCADFETKPCAALRMKVDSSGKACLAQGAGTTDAKGDG